MGDQAPISAPPIPKKTVECNMMVYMDCVGIKHEIYMPKGTMQRAGKLLEEKNWDELAKYPKWGKLIPLFEGA